MALSIPARCCPRQRARRPTHTPATRFASLMPSGTSRTRKRPTSSPTCCSSMRARDALGRPVPAGSPDAVEPVSEQALAPHDAVALARRLLSEGRAFSAHEVFEASWKAAPPDERTLWQGLAQVCVGLTHLQRGNV